MFPEFSPVRQCSGWEEHVSLSSHPASARLAAIRPRRSHSTFPRLNAVTARHQYLPQKDPWLELVDPQKWMR